jgi:hypothetical protein
MENTQRIAKEILSRPEFAACPGGGHYRLNQWRHWSASDVAKLRVLAEAGSPPEASADALGRMEKSIAYKARDLGIKIPVSWAAYLPKPKKTCAKPQPVNQEPPQGKKVALSELKMAAMSIDKVAEDSDEFRAAMVVMYPIVVGGMDVGEIARFTSINSLEVQEYESNLRQGGIWTADNKVLLESDIDGQEVMVELVLHIMCALGWMERVTVRDEPASA